MVMDLVRPRVGGRKLPTWIDASRPDLPVVVSSGHEAGATELDPPGSCVRAVLPKPYLPSELVPCLRGLDGSA